jgi:hypothetical protein
MHIKIIKHQNDPKLSCACSLVLNKLREPACSHGISTELGLLIYKGKHA